MRYRKQFALLSAGIAVTIFGTPSAGAQSGPAPSPAVWSTVSPGGRASGAVVPHVTVSAVPAVTTTISRPTPTPTPTMKLTPSPAPVPSPSRAPASLAPPTPTASATAARGTAASGLAAPGFSPVSSPTLADAGAAATTCALFPSVVTTTYNPQATTSKVVNLSVLIRCRHVTANLPFTLELPSTKVVRSFQSASSTPLKYQLFVENMAAIDDGTAVRVPLLVPASPDGQSTVRVAIRMFIAPGQAIDARKTYADTIPVRATY